MSDAAVIAGSIKSITIYSREFPVDGACEALLNVGSVKNTPVVFGGGSVGWTQEFIPWSLSGVELVISDNRGQLGLLAGAFNAAVGAVGGAIGGAVGGAITGLGIPAPPTGPDRLFLAQVAARAIHVPILVTLVDDTVWAGVGNIDGPIDTSTKTGLARLDLKGDGQMVQQ